MPSEKRKFGDIGEEVVCNFLRGKGLTIVEQNYLKPFGEIDIIAKKGKALHFVEVKTSKRDFSRENNQQKGYRPEENVHKNKLKRLNKAVESYLIEHKISRETDIQVDVAIVLLDLENKKAKIDLIENVL